MKQKELRRFVIHVSILVAALLLAFGALSSAFFVSQVRSRALRNRMDVLRQTELLMATALGVVVRNAYTAAIHQSIVTAAHRNWDAPEMTENLQRAVRVLKARVESSYYVQSIALYSRLNDAVVSDAGLIPLRSYSEREIAEGFYLSDRNSAWVVRQEPDTGAEPTAHSIILLIRVPIELTTAPGILVVTVDEGLLHHTVLAVNRRLLGEILVMDEEGRIVSHGDRKKPSNHLESTRLVPESSASGYLVTSRSDRKQFVSYYTSPYNGWKYVAVNDYELVAADTAPLLRIYLMSAVLLVIVGVGAAFRVSRTLYEPISNIVHQVENRPWPVADAPGTEGEFQIIENAIESMYQQNVAMVSRVREHLIASLLMGHDVEHSVREEDIFTSDVSFEEYAVAVCRLLNDSTAGADGGPAVSLANLAGEKSPSLADAGIGIAVIQRGRDGVALIVGSSKTTPPRSQPAWNATRAIADHLSTAVGVPVAAGIGSGRAELPAVAESYEEALEALRCAGPHELIVSYEDVHRLRFDHASHFAIVAEKEALFRELASGQFARAQHTVEAVVSRIAHDSTLSASYKRIALASVAGDVISHCASSLPRDGEIMSQGIPIGPGESFASEPLRFAAALQGVIERHALDSDRCHGCDGRDVAETVERYIQANYEGELDIGRVAAVVGLNPSYLGRVFKERTGKTLLQYITAVRVSAAVKLLRSSDKLVSEIARETGFVNKRNMARAFKRSLGINPRAARTEAAIERITSINTVGNPSSDLAPQ